MTHPRKVIRKAFTERLRTPVDGVYRTAAGSRIFPSRIAPVALDDDDELPAILIYTRTEDRDPEKDYGAEAEDTFARAKLKIVVEALVRGGETVDDKLDDIAEQIEAALEDWDIPGFEAACVRLGDTDVDVITEGVRRPVGAIGLTWHVTYDRPWRVRDPGTRPDTVDLIINGGSPERLITRDKGVRNP
ncbi:hypothetical protein [Methylobacterium sp. WCS2018Hpa-22]|uniref:hypothetical protein n=1 Tax=Methylobacterium sp. WCS2018Hpa-22 TaxID=3073633 RepID=UPI002889636E|nr:hypothetical protein [Methylobacterium sp. WCS2018Hpa-22]